MNLISTNNTQQIVPATQKTNNKKCETSIFYMNDVHGQIPKMQRLFSAANHAQVVAENKNSDFFKLCSGDTFIGSDDKRNIAAASFLNMTRVDAETLGNHEFDITASICGKILKDNNTKILGMNLNFPDDKSDLSQKVLRSTVLDGKNGEKYGVIGIQPPDINHRLKNKSSLEGITVDDEAQTLNELQEEVNQLKNQGINKIILLSHSGNAFEKEIAQKINGIDIILGGHSHHLIKDIKEGENLLYSPSGEPVVITQAGRDGNHFGVLNVEFDENGVLTKVQNTVTETNKYSPNAIMSTTIDKILGKSPEIGKLGYVDPLPENNLTAENPWASFVSDAIKETLNAEVVLINSANFRGSVDLGRVTERDIESIFPFNNKLYKVNLNEKDLVEAIKFGAKSLVSKNSKPGLLQVGGLEYTLDTEGNLKELSYKDKQGKKSYIDINNPNPEKMYVTVYDEFLVKGGDNMSMLKKDPELNKDDILEHYTFDKDKVTIDYIKTLNQPFEVRCDNRIKIVD